MAKIDLYDPKWVDLVFAGKNQGYGAYKLRKGTSGRNIKALVILIIAAALVGGFLAWKVIQQKNAEQQQAYMEAMHQLDAKIAVGTETHEGAKDRTIEAVRNDIAVATPPPAPKEEVTQKVFDVVEVMPSFPGGQGALIQYLNSHVKYPVVAQENGIQGRVTISFVVERDGSITDVKVARSVDPSLDKEAARVVSSMPRWTPGKQNGSAVRVKFNVPVVFKLQQ